MLRRPSTAESSASSSDVTFDDVDDSHVLAFLDDGNSSDSPGRRPSKTVEFRLDFSSRLGHNSMPASPPSPLSPSQQAAKMRRRSSVRRPSTTGHGGGSPSSSGSPQSHTATGTAAISQRLPRSPSMRTQPPAAGATRKRLTKRQSAPIQLTPEEERLVQLAAVTSSGSMSPGRRQSDAMTSRPAATSPSSTPPKTSPSHSPASSPAIGPASVSAAVPAPPPLQLKTASSAPAPPVSTPTHSLIAERAAAAASQALLDKTQRESDALRAELSAARAAIVELEQRVRDSNDTSDAVAAQLAALRERNEERLRASDVAHQAALAELARRKDEELRDQQAQFRAECETFKTELASLTRIKNEVHTQNERLLTALDAQSAQTQQLEVQCRALQTELRLERERRLDLESWKATEQHRADVSLVAKCEALEASAARWEGQCQELQDQVHQLLAEQQELRGSQLEAEQRLEREFALRRVLYERFVAQVQLLHGQLRALTTDTKEQLRKEMKKNQQTLTSVEQQAREMAIHLNDKAVALVAKQNRVIQLEAQLKNERQTVHQLELALSKTTRVLERKEATFKTKYQEQREFLEITTAVRNGLTTELQAKKKQLAVMEQQVKALTLSKSDVEKRNKHLSQQVKIMQQMHAREMEKFAVSRQAASREPTAQVTARDRDGRARTQGTSIVTTAPSGDLRSSSASVASLVLRSSVSNEKAPKEQHTRDECEPSSNGRVLWARDGDDEGDQVNDVEWREFVELTAAYEEECRLQMDRHATQELCRASEFSGRLAL
ncbi:hypothetical protein P43SY_005369 [Pythium insidiosum]|uniref:Uncharacterized protein n=1 Tax=Pythium insidiosum TaxID=114742 RepID=A0AAD5LFL0_PYTIN|nr:hypothetical protein P43SY_005369 [Pythium insidiosum]